MMEFNGEEKEPCGAGPDCYAQQEIESRSSERDRQERSGQALGGSVYFIQSADGAFVKIGFTA